MFVEQGATLTIEPGTRIEGEPGSALVVTAKSSLRAQGERQAPIVMTSTQAAGDNAIEADNNRDDHDAKPRSAPTLANLTLLSPPDAEGQRRALLLRRGTAADLRNVLVAGFNGALLDVRDAATAGLAGADRLRLRGLLGHRIGPDGTTWTRPEAGETDDDGGFDEGRFLRAGGQWLGRDPGLPASALG
ncbi:MAG: hypothetical protein BRD57_01635, partial [Proteobacteria bacterium SW_6_67_9]